MQSKFIIRYVSFNKKWFWIMVPIAILVIISQIFGAINFALDPKGEMDRIRKSSEMWRE